MTTLTQTPAEHAEQAEGREGKYLTFQLAGETYGIGIMKVREIIGLTDITPVPQTPPYVRGVINLRGRVVPVMDLRARLGLAGGEAGPAACIVVVQVNGADVGLTVDRVWEVAEVAGGSVEDVPALGAAARASLLLGIAKVEAAVLLLLDIDRVLAGEELPAPAPEAATV